VDEKGAPAFSSELFLLPESGTLDTVVVARLIEPEASDTLGKLGCAIGGG
jgi:hypothetical protein